MRGVASWQLVINGIFNGVGRDPNPSDEFAVLKVIASWQLAFNGIFNGVGRDPDPQMSSPFKGSCQLATVRGEDNEARCCQLATSLERKAPRATECLLPAGNGYQSAN
jgi:hypothetical protein